MKTRRPSSWWRSVDKMGHQLSSWPQEGSNPEVPGRLAVWEVAREDKNKRYIKKVSKRGE